METSKEQMWEVEVNYGGNYLYKTALSAPNKEKAELWAVDECLDSGMCMESTSVYAVSCTQLNDY